MKHRFLRRQSQTVGTDTGALRYDITDRSMCSTRVAGLLAILISWSNCGDVRLGADGIVQCPNLFATLANLDNVTLRHSAAHPNEDKLLTLYSKATNRSTEKYILALDLANVTVKRLMVNDEGSYSCQVVYRPFGSPRFTTSSTTLTVYGK